MELVEMGAVVSYVVILGGMFAVAMGLFFAFRAIKLI
jgi:Cytochrome B6-F complex subunit VI (PetL)